MYISLEGQVSQLLDSIEKYKPLEQDRHSFPSKNGEDSGQLFVFEALLPSSFYKKAFAVTLTGSKIPVRFLVFVTVIIIG